MADGTISKNLFHAIFSAGAYNRGRGAGRIDLVPAVAGLLGRSAVKLGVK